MEAVKIRTAYGIKETNSVLYTDRAELVTRVNGALSIRGKNPKEFYSKLEELLKQYEG